VPVQTEYDRLVATYGLGKIADHINILKKYDPMTKRTKYWCEVCGWVQWIGDREAYSSTPTLNTLPKYCWTYKERWEGKYDE
jgi:hypothetical protein